VAAVSKTSHGISLLRDGRKREARTPLLQGLAHAPELRAFAALVLTFLPQVTFRAADRFYRTWLRRGARRATA
ncbi:MAG TPA: hypothetical protein VFR62_11585, partial [Gemmatimonadales bacterium]|nr:hypothetical protein [Gemmatimonadales bacterium]